MQIAALPAENLQPTNLYARLNNKEPKLTVRQVEGYLEANRRNASSS
jgi:hypothetical protein